MREAGSSAVGVLLGLTLALNLAGLVLLLWRMLAFEANHWGLDQRWALPLLATEFALSPLLRRHSARAHHALAFCAVAAILTILISVHANVLLPYELWLSRGMPGRWS